MSYKPFQDRDNSLNKIEEAVRDADEHVLSAEEIASRIGMTRQYVHKRLSDSDTAVERVEIGPSVGYYWDRTGIEIIENELDGHALNYGKTEESPYLSCKKCGREMYDNDPCIVSFYKLARNLSWLAAGQICTSHSNLDIEDIPEVSMDDPTLEKCKEMEFPIAVAEGKLSKFAYDDPSSEGLRTALKLTQPNLRRVISH